MAERESITDLIAKAKCARGIPSSNPQVPYANIRDLLDQQAGRYGDSPWLTFYPDESRGSPVEYTYRKFHIAVSKTANLLLGEGIHRGDKVATVAFNHADTVIQYYAAWVIGAVVVPINVGEEDNRIAYILRNSGAKLAFVRAEFVRRIEKIARETPLTLTVVRCVEPDEQPPSGEDGNTGEPDGAVSRYTDFSTVIAKQEAAIHGGTEPSLDDEALIVYTSGTTGNPKGVVLTQYNLLIDARSIAEWHGMNSGDRMMCVLPIHHVNGTIVTLVTPMVYGGSVVLNRKFHTQHFFQRLAAERVQVVSVVPTLLQFLLHDNPDVSQFDLSAFRHIICGAGPLTVDLALRFEDRFHFPIVHGYGLSETTCYSCFLPLDLTPGEHRSWLGEYGFPSIGAPIASNEMAIHDALGNELAEGVKGEIVIRGHNVMKEYHANAEANASAFAFGWFRSGDEGFYKADAKGRKFFFITGRIKELIIRGGVNISPFEIDEVLMNMPGVKAGLAVGFDNDWYGEEVGAYVQPLEGIHLPEEAVLLHCRKFFTFAKSPKVVIFGNEIPVTSTGKYQRGKLTSLFEKWKSVQFREEK